MIYLYFISPVLLFLFVGIRIVRPTHRGLIERFGKYHHFAYPGFLWNIPIIDRLYLVNITEQMVYSEPIIIITNDSLHTSVNAQVYFKVKSDEASVKGSIYNVNNYQDQIVDLARYTIRNSIGNLTYNPANIEEGKINIELYKKLKNEAQAWGIEIVRTELKEIDPPKDVQETMMIKMVKAEKEKIGTIDSARAPKTEAVRIKLCKMISE